MLSEIGMSFTPKLYTFYGNAIGFCQIAGEFFIQSIGGGFSGQNDSDLSSKVMPKSEESVLIKAGKANSFG